MKKSRLFSDDGIAHTRVNPQGRKERKKKETYHTPTPQAEIDICLSCPYTKCHPTSCKRIQNVCKNCKHLSFSDCYGECSKGYKEGVVHPYDSCEHFEKRRK